MLNKSRRVSAKMHESLGKPDQSVFSDHFNLKIWSKNSKPDLESVRFSVVIAKKTTKSAVLRNSARRRVYSVIRKSFFDKTLGMVPTIFVFYIKKPITEISYEELVSEIDFLAKKATI